MHKAHLLSTPMVVQSLEVSKSPFRPQEENEEPFGPEILYLGALRYLANVGKLYMHSGRI